MKNEDYLEVNLTELGRFVPPVSADMLSEDFFISKISDGSDLSALKHPFRFNGFLACFCSKGKFQIEINLKQFNITQGTLLIYVPGNFVSLADTRNMEDSRFVVVAVSQRILQNSKLDLTKIFEDALSVMANPCIRLKDNEIEICRKYYRLAEMLVHESLPSLDISLMELGSSVFHYLGSLWSERITEGETIPGSSLRSKMVFEDFMKLIAKNHTTEREVGFYADKLNLSPKYLSQVIKKATGQSAPDWISSFVILEAKNYLKYSSLDVKEIAYKLNFSSTPVFFRYFKSHTGMTPVEYRKS